MENKILNISFKENIYKNIKELYFLENKEIIYYDNSHMNYIYNIKIGNILYTFYGYFKDDYFNIILDTYSFNLDVTIKNKLTILIKLDWDLIKLNDSENQVWVIDITKNQNFESILLPIRIKMLDNNISLEDYLKISNQRKINITIKLI